MIRTSVLAALLVAACAMSVRAAETAPPLKATTKDAFAGVVVDLHKEMQEDGRYADVTERERADIDANLDRMQALFEKSGSVETMGKDEQVALFNAQESVNAILEKRDRDRLICERSATTGSRISTTHCRTYGEIEAQREASQKMMRDKPAKNGCIHPHCK
jgi:hypothetical protein